MCQNTNDRAKEYAEELMKMYGSVKQVSELDKGGGNDSALQEQEQNIYNAEEHKDIINSCCYTETGTLMVETTSVRSAVPVNNVLVIITRGTKLFGLLLTDSDGRTRRIDLPAPPRRNSESPEMQGDPFALYDTEVYCKGYYAVKNTDIPIFAGTDSVLPVNMIPLPAASGSREINFYT